MSFGPNYAVMHRQAAGYVDRILKGADPADLPIEQSAKFELVVNLSSAKALGLVIRQPILRRAVEIIEQQDSPGGNLTVQATELASPDILAVTTPIRFERRVG